MSLNRFRDRILPRKTADNFPQDHLALFREMGPDPMSYARGHLSPRGRGSAADLFAHPTDPRLVVRVSAPRTFASLDGWFPYAEEIRMRRDPAVPNYGPVLLDMAVVEDQWVAVTPALTPISREADLEVMACARRLIDPIRFGDALPTDAAVVGKAQPGFLAFAAAHLERASDLGRDNFMMDGWRMIVNDPIPTMDPQDEARLRSLYDIAARLDGHRPEM